MIQAETPREEVLIEELELARKSRDEVKDELYLLKEKYENNLSFYVVGSDTTNIGIRKGDSSISLNRDEMKKFLEFAHKERFIY